MAETVWDIERTYELPQNGRPLALFAVFALFSGALLYSGIGILWEPTQNFRHPGDKYMPIVVLCFTFVFSVWNAFNQLRIKIRNISAIKVNPDGIGFYYETQFIRWDEIKSVSYFNKFIYLSIALNIDLATNPQNGENFEKKHPIGGARIAAGCTDLEPEELFSLIQAFHKAYGPKETAA